MRARSPLRGSAWLLKGFLACLEGGVPPAATAVAAAVTPFFPGAGLPVVVGLWERWLVEWSGMWTVLGGVGLHFLVLVVH